MKTIPISGTIGWDVMPADVRRQISEADGKEPLDVQISSPGGYVTEGLEIFNLIKNYPGPKNTHLMGEAASMASYIALAGDKVTAEPNSIYMIHNVLGCACGNHNDLRKTADVFEGFTNLLAQAYAAKTGKPLTDIRQMMDNETYLFGTEAKEAGFVDEILGEPAPAEDRDAAISVAKAHRAACDELVAKSKDAGAVDKLAAMIGYTGQERKPAASATPVPQSPTAAVGSSAAAAPAADNKKKEVPKMDLDLNKLKAEHADVFAAAKAEGYTEGQAAGAAAERKRLADIDALGLIGDNAKIAEDAKADGKSTAADVALKVVQASKGKTIQMRADRAADAGELPAPPAGGAEDSAHDDIQTEIDKFAAAKKKAEGGK